MSLSKKLYELIRTFDKNDKRQLKMRMEGQTKSAGDYERLFAYFDALEAWDAEKVEADLRKKWQNRAYSLCKGLYSWLLRVIVDRPWSSVYRQAWTLLLQIDALHYRQQYQAAWEQMQELETLCEQTQVGALQYLLHNWQLSYLRHQVPGLPRLGKEEELEAFLAKGKHYLNNLELEQAYNDASYRLLFYFNHLPQGQEREDKLEQLLQQPIFSLAPADLDYAARHKYYYHHTFYHLNRGNYEEVLRSSIESLEFVLSLPDTWHYSANSIYGIWSNIFSAAAYVGDAEAYRFYKDKLLQVLPQAPKDLPFENLLHEPGAYTEFLLAYRAGQSAALYARLPEFKAFLQDKASLLMYLRQSQWHYWLALLCYEQGDYAQAEDFLQPYLGAKRLVATFSLEVILHFLQLLIHYEQANWRLLGHLSRAYYRRLSAKHPLSLTERRWFRLLYNLGRKKSKSKIQGYIERFSSYLSRQDQLSRHEKDLRFYFDLSAWLDKIQRRSI